VSDLNGVDLDRGRDLGDLLRTTAALYRQNLGTVLAIAGAIVVTVDLIVGIGLNEIGSRYRSSLGPGAGTVQVLVSLLVITPLINATAAQLVLELSRDRRPRAREVLQRGLDVFAPALIAVVLYAVAVAAGMFVLVLPGIYLLVLWYFATQSVTIDGRRGFAALQRSGELVGGAWFRVAGILLVVTAVGNVVPALAIGAAVDAAAKAADAQVVALAGTMLIQLFSLPFVALAAALLYFDLRARKAAAVRSPPAA
jgi:hypothetical protein